ncbi:hypothetical protein J4Q44_G00042760 [Coregonus suidteri]|uniref:Uncharacterized protein n=1 Tax=Coregonus suidteri TaxID=861788 RepID=A0AAN8R658_9TELE
MSCSRLPRRLLHEAILHMEAHTAYSIIILAYKRPFPGKQGGRLEPLDICQIGGTQPRRTEHAEKIFVWTLIPVKQDPVDEVDTVEKRISSDVSAFALRNGQTRLWI